MNRLADYQFRYPNIAMSRHEGVLEVTLHRAGESAQWTIGEGGLHAQLGEAFNRIGADDDNRVVILTGTGQDFLTRMDASAVFHSAWNLSGHWRG